MFILNHSLYRGYGVCRGLTAFYEGDLNLVSSNSCFLSNALAFLCQRVAVVFHDLRQVADKYYVQCNNLFLFFPYQVLWWIFMLSLMLL